MSDPIAQGARQRGLADVFDPEPLRLVEVIGLLGSLAVAASIIFMWGYSVALKYSLARSFSIADYAALAVEWIPPMLFAMAVTLPIVRAGFSLIPPAREKPFLYGISGLIVVGTLVAGAALGDSGLLFLGFWALLAMGGPVLILRLVRARWPGSERVVLWSWVGFIVASLPFSAGFQAAVKSPKGHTAVYLTDGSFVEGKIHFVLADFVIFTPEQSDTIVAYARTVVEMTSHTRVEEPEQEAPDDTTPIGPPERDSREIPTARDTSVGGGQRQP